MDFTDSLLSEYPCIHVSPEGQSNGMLRIHSKQKNITANKKKKHIQQINKVYAYGLNLLIRTGREKKNCLNCSLK